jgi:hypothetical protein
MQHEKEQPLSKLEFATHKREFAMREHEAMQAKIQRAVEDLYRTETIIPLAIAAIYAWLWTDSSRIGVATAWLHLLPPVLAVLGLLRQKVRNGYLKLAETYVQRIERDVYGQCDPHTDICGWETYYLTDRETGHHKLRRSFWLLLIAVTSGLAAYVLWTRLLAP